MFSIKDLIIGEVKKGLEKGGVAGDVDLLGDAIVITIKAEEIKKTILNGIPEPYRAVMTVECGDIKIKMKVL